MCQEVQKSVMIYSEICSSIYLDVSKANSGVFDPVLTDLYRYFKDRKRFKNSFYSALYKREERARC